MKRAQQTTEMTGATRKLFSSLFRSECTFRVGANNSRMTEINHFHFFAFLSPPIVLVAIVRPPQTAASDQATSAARRRRTKRFRGSERARK